MDLTELLVRAIEGEITEHVVTDFGYLRFEVSNDEIRVMVGSGAEKREIVWERIMEVI